MQTFSTEKFIRTQVQLADAIQMVGILQADGDSYVMFPSSATDGAAFRFPQSAVAIIEVLPATMATGTNAQATHRIAVPKGTRCVALCPGTIESFVSLASHEREAEREATQVAQIAFGANGEGTITFNGVTRPCLGKTGLAYPRDLTINTSDKYRRRFSNEFQVWMDFAVLIWGQRGIFIHQGASTLATNGGETAGCIHIASPHAEEFYNWITGRTRITIAYPW